MTAAMVTIASNAGAQGPANQDTYFTFSQAVELPKTTLPAGTYFIQPMDSQSNRHIVKVMSQDRKQLLAIPYYSTDRPSDKPEVRFLEMPAANNVAASNAIKIWFDPTTPQRSDAPAKAPRTDPPHRRLPAAARADRPWLVGGG